METLLLLFVVMADKLWNIPRIWPGEDVFIIASGPSVKQQDLRLLKGRHVIVINSSWEIYPSADFLFFADWRWWVHNQHKLLAGFHQPIATISRTVRAVSTDHRLRFLDKVKPPPFLVTNTTQKVSVRHTSLTGAINIAVHLGAARVVLLGADMQKDKNGKAHHHTEHPWPVPKDGWKLMMEDLQAMSSPLSELGIEVINTSMQSRIDWWKKVPLEDCIESAVVIHNSRVAALG